MNRQEIIMNGLKSYISMKLDNALNEALANKTEGERGILSIIVNEFLPDPIYTDFLSSAIAKDYYESYKPQLHLTSGVANVCQQITNDELVRKALVYHSFAYQDALNVRRSEEETLGRK